MVKRSSFHMGRKTVRDNISEMLLRALVIDEAVCKTARYMQECAHIDERSQLRFEVSVA